LIIAVSFGLFVPSRLLRSSSYGGLNVHPSLLPDLKGAAPLQWALLTGRSHTGVSVQTLSPVAFDAGTVLAQTPLPGIPVPPGCTLPHLRDLLAPIGAEMLVSALRAGLYLPPLKAAGWEPTEKEAKDLVLARKITKGDRWEQWTGDEAKTAREWALRARVLGSLWTVALRKDGEERRVIFEEVEEVPQRDWPEEAQLFMRRLKETKSVPNEAESTDDMLAVTYFQESDESGRRQMDMPYFPDGEAILIPMVRGGCIRVKTVKVEGEKSRPAAKAMEAFATKHSSESSWYMDVVWSVFNCTDALVLPTKASLDSLLP
jgi:methionyl-tRNA formyltransferase